MKYFVSLLLFFVPSLALACSFAEDADIFKPQGEIIANYENAFVAYLGPRIETQTEDSPYTGKYELRIEQVYKGDLLVGDTLTIESQGHSCAYFGPGNQYGSFLYGETINEIAEYNPKQLFDTRAEAIAYADAQFGFVNEPTTEPGINSETENNTEVVVTNPVDAEGNPLFGPEVGFVEPTTPPPYDNTPEFDREPESVSLWQKIMNFFVNLFNL